MRKVKEVRPGRNPVAASDEASAPAGSRPAERRDAAPTPKVDSPARVVPERPSRGLPRTAPRLGWLPFALAFAFVAALAVALWWTA